MSCISIAARTARASTISRPWNQRSPSFPISMRNASATASALATRPRRNAERPARARDADRDATPGLRVRVAQALGQLHRVAEQLERFFRIALQDHRAVTQQRCDVEIFVAAVR